MISVHSIPFSSAAVKDNGMQGKEEDEGFHCCLVSQAYQKKGQQMGFGMS